MSRTHRSCLVLLVVCAFACGGDGQPPPDAPERSADLLREHAAALYTEDEFERAEAVMAPLVETEQASVDDLLRATLIVMGRAETGDPEKNLDRAWALVERLHGLAPDDARVLFLRGVLLLGHHFDPQRAATAFQEVLEVHPDNLQARIQLGDALMQLDDVDGALAQYGKVQDLGSEVAGSLYVTAVYKMGQILIRRQGPEAGMPLINEQNELREAGINAATRRELERGPLAEFATPQVHGLDAGREPVNPLGTFRLVTTAPLPGAERLVAADIDHDGRTDLLSFGSAGVSVSLQEATARFGEAVSVITAEVVGLTAADLDEDLERGGTLELVALERSGGGALQVRLLAYSRADGSWSAWGPGTLDVAAPRGAVPSDFDHDGDLDLVVPTEVDGVRLLRNDGGGTLADATPPVAAGILDALSVQPEDIDGDNDVDYLVQTATGHRALSNDRGGQFSDANQSWGIPDVQGPLTIRDLDADGRPDLAWNAEDGVRWARNGEREYSIAGTLPWSTPVAEQALVTSPGWSLHDLNLDGYPDLLTVGDGPGTLVVFRGPLYGRAPQAETLLDGLDDRAGGFVVGDLLGGEPPEPDARAVGDGRLELAVARADGVEIYQREGADGFSLTLLGEKDNDAGVGAIVEVRAGERYERRYWRGGRHVLGLGGATEATFVGVTWPNGVNQFSFAVPRGSSLDILQVDRNAGSCPFLYTWDGERFVFVTDVLGATPLGLPMGPGQLVPFDHEEYVKVRGDQLVTDEQGRLRMAVTEELREVTYLDRVRLHVVDHPAETEIQPDEAFVFPPFPPHHVHTLTDVLPPASALAHRAAEHPRGAPEDVTDTLTSLDGHHARPFQTLHPQLRGLTEPWSLDLAFGRDDAERAAIRRAPRLRLALTGWFQWGDASVNMAAARHPRAAFVPPELWLPDGAGGWRKVGPPLGFPAGKTKTMIVDLTDVLDRDDPRLRLTTTLELSWDAVRLVVDGDDAPMRETVLEATVAELRFRGFSSMRETGRDDWPEIFDWEVLTSDVPWNQHEGLYTRYGDVLPLLGAVDDRTVILGAGDAIDLVFDGNDLPALPPGWTRSYLVYLDGWAKDGDPNTLASQTVAPLPFHGMSTYPPPPGESFPDTPEHRAWARDWNTRPGRRLVPSLVPGQDDDLLAAWERPERGGG